VEHTHETGLVSGEGQPVSCQSVSWRRLVLAVFGRREVQNGCRFEPRVEHGG
jgi:hypothetical protein